MKRYIVLLMVFACLLCGCNAQKNQIKKPVNFYYINETVVYNSGNGMLSPEIRESAGYEEDLLGLLNVYVAGPVDTKHISPFPDRLSVSSVVTEEQTASVIVGDQLCMLTGHDLSLACICLARTVMELTETDIVHIRVADRMLGGKTEITIRADDLVFVDTATYSPSDPG